MTYTIPSKRIDNLVKRLEKFNRKALKNQSLPIVFSVSKPYDKIFQEKEIDADTGKSIIVDKIISMVDIEIDTESFKPIKGYRLCACIENTEQGNIILNKIPGVEVPHKYRKSENHCDHCNTDRYRRFTYIIYNEETKDFVQVGSTCIKDYLGVNLSLIASRFQFLDELVCMSDHNGFGSYYEPTVPIYSFLATCLNIIEHDGFVSSKMAFETQGTKRATGNVTWEVMTDHFKPTNSQTYREWVIERRRYTEEHLNEATKMIDWVKEQDTTKDYFYNLSMIVNLGYVTRKTVRFACSIIPCYRKAMNMIKPKKEYKPSEFIGKIGEKITFEAVCTKSFDVNGAFGLMCINTLMTDNDEIIVWYNPKGLEEEKRYSITATVKDHKVYKDKKQTIILRPKIKEI